MIIICSWSLQVCLTLLIGPFVSRYDNKRTYYNSNLALLVSATSEGVGLPKQKIFLVFCLNDVVQNIIHSILISFFLFFFFVSEWQGIQGLVHKWGSNRVLLGSKLWLNHKFSLKVWTWWQFTALGNITLDIFANKSPYLVFLWC